MSDYHSAYADFDLAKALSALSGSAEDGLNAAIECCDRWCGENRVALHWASDDGGRAHYTFEQLRDASSQLANLFVALGVRPGDRVAGLLPRKPDLLITILATWRLGAAYQPLFTAFGPKAIEHRMTGSGAKVIVTDPVNRAKLSDLELTATIVVTDAGSDNAASDVILSDALRSESSTFATVLRALDDPFLAMFTSGTTGPAKLLWVPLRAIAAFIGYMRDAVDLRPEDAFWNLADPGWAYGLYYAVVGPLALGHATLFYGGSFSAAAAVRIIAEFGVSNLAGAPTAFRQLVAAGPEAVRPIVDQLRVVSSAGEPLTPAIAAWFEQHLHCPVYDHYGQTELGMVVCNHHRLLHRVTPGSAGFPVPGHRVVVLDDGDVELPAHEPGILAIDRANSPLFWFRGYEHAPSDASRYYRSGDAVELNEDDSISFLGRSDDVITSSGYRIGPFDVESALAEHPAVAEAAVIGKPDPDRTEIVKAFVILVDGEIGGPELVEELQKHVKRRLSAHAFPREIEFADQLPKTPSGKVQRFLLREADRSRTAATLLSERN